MRKIRQILTIRLPAILCTRIKVVLRVHAHALRPAASLNATVPLALHETSDKKLKKTI
jgi:hypothetical protein